MIGSSIYSFIQELFPLSRSITGDGVRKTLSIIQSSHLADLKLHEIATGTNVEDWIVPEEWNIFDAYIKDKNDHKVIDFNDSNLHVVGYSEAVNKEISNSELQGKLFSLPELPEAIPYVTSYYQKTWGFCLSQNQREKLTDDSYHVYIDSKFHKGSLTYADLVIAGQSDDEIFISTYICHPSMANNELSGPGLGVYLAKWLKGRSNRYTYRFVFAPETIGSIVYMSENLDTLKENTIAAFNLTCVGDNNNTSFLPSRSGNTVTDKVSRHVLNFKKPDHVAYDFIKDRGSDERQYCSPGVDLPMVSIMATKYGEYPEYHTSLDNMDFVSAEGLESSYQLHIDCIDILENNYYYESNIHGEPFLSKRGKGYMIVGGVENESSSSSQLILDVLSCCDGTKDIVDIADELNMYAKDLFEVFDYLLNEDLIKVHS